MESAGRPRVTPLEEGALFETKRALPVLECIDLMDQLP